MVVNYKLLAILHNTLNRLIWHLLSQMHNWKGGEVNEDKAA